MYRVFAVELDHSVGEVVRLDRPNMHVGYVRDEALGPHVKRLLVGREGPDELRGHVVRDRPDLYGHLVAATRRRARELERTLACDLIRSWHGVFGHPRWRIYVIRLDASQQYPESDRPWVYVGLTSKSPESRFDEHKRGARNARGRLYNRLARDYGTELWRECYEDVRPCCSLDEAKDAEKELAERLYWDKGFRVEGDGLPPEHRGR